MGRSKIDWNVPAKAFLGAYRESGNKFLDFRLTQEEQRRTTDKAAAQDILTQMTAMATGGSPGAIGRAQEWARTQLGDLTSDTSRKRVERGIESLEVLGKEQGIRARELFTQTSKGRSEDLASITPMPFSAEGFRERGTAAADIRRRQREAGAAYEPFRAGYPTDVSQVVGPRAEVLVTGSEQMARALEGFPWPFKAHDLEDSEELERLYLQGGGLSEGFSSWLTEINRINKNSSQTKLIDFVNRSSGNLEVAAKSGWFSPQYMDAALADSYHTLYTEGEKSKTDAVLASAYRNLLTGLSSASRHGSVALASESLDSYVREGGSKELSERLRPSLSNIVHIDDSKNFESYMSKIMMSVLKGEIPGKLNSDTQEYEPPNIQKVRQDAIILWNTFHPDRRESATQGAAAPNGVHEDLATVLTRNLIQISDPEAQVAETIKVRDKLNGRDSNYLEGMKNTNAIKALPDSLKAILFQESINVFEPATPEGQPIQDDRSLGLRIGAGAAELSKGAVTPGGMWPPPSMSNIGDAVARGSNALVRFGSDLIEGASGVNPREVLREQNKKAEDFWVGGTDKVLEGASLIRYEEMRKLNELGYSKDDLEVLSYREIKDILQNKVPRPSDFQTSQPKGFLERAREVVEPPITSAVSSLQQPEVEPQDLGWPPLQVRLKLQELGYNVEDIRSFSPEEISAIVEKNIPASQAR